jgi:hypothetical protein
MGWLKVFWERAPDDIDRINMGWSDFEKMRVPIGSMARTRDYWAASSATQVPRIGADKSRLKRPAGQPTRPEFPADAGQGPADSSIRSLSPCRIGQIQPVARLD